MTMNIISIMGLQRIN